MASISKGLIQAVVFFYGLFTLFLYGLSAIRKGYFFKRPTEKERLELQLARNTFWDLSKKWSGLSHGILTLKDGFKFHYMHNDVPGDQATSHKPLVLFIHGFPDSWALWRYIVSSASLQQSASVVAVDLPGFGGSGSLEKYSATSVLEKLTEFVITMRAKYGVDSEAGPNQKRTVIVAHDWGMVLATRLAAEAPELADRFIFTNAPIPSLARSNIARRVSSSVKMLKTAMRSPIQSRSMIMKAFMHLKPVFKQALLSGYIFAFQLPIPLVRYIGEGGNYSFLKICHKASYGQSKFTPQDAAECMASTMGPSIEECSSKTDTGEEYPVCIRNERARSNFHHMTAYYRDSAASSRWHKSLEAIAALHAISGGKQLRRASSGAGLFDEGPQGVIKAPSTVLWGKKDAVLDPQICLDGITDYLGANSYVVELRRSGHFTPLEHESQVALERAAEWAAKGERDDIGGVLGECYAEAVVTVRK